MNLEETVRSRLTEKPLLLMTHAVVGYPSLEENWRMMEAMGAAGVDLVELQLPFSEPIADGPAFIRANQKAIEAAIGWDAYFEFFRRAAEAFPFAALFMGYYNGIYRMGEATFVRRLADAGGRGFIVADLPPEEALELNRLGRERELDPIVLMTPTSSDARLSAIAAQASGMVYCVARKGVTGAHTDLAAGTIEFLERCRRATALPLGLGFGIHEADDVRAVRGHADVAIVGTACLRRWEESGPRGYREFLEDLVAATR